MYDSLKGEVTHFLPNLGIKYGEMHHVTFGMAWPYNISASSPHPPIVMTLNELDIKSSWNILSLSLWLR